MVKYELHDWNGELKFLQVQDGTFLVDPLYEDYFVEMFINGGWRAD